MTLDTNKLFYDVPKQNNDVVDCRGKNKAV